MSGERQKNEDTTPSPAAWLGTHESYDAHRLKHADHRACNSLAVLFFLQPRSSPKSWLLSLNNSSHGLTSGSKVRVARAEAPLCRVKPPVKGGEA